MLLTATTFREWFGDIFFPLGFSYYKRTFYRIYGDVIQFFSGASMHGMARMGFYMEPLCGEVWPIDPDNYTRNDILILFQSRNPNFIPFSSIFEENLIQQIRALVQEEVVPIFQESVDARTAYENLVQFRRMYFTSLSGFRRIPEDKAEEAIEKDVSSINLICLCLKSGDFENAQRHMHYVQSAIFYPWKEEYERRVKEGVWDRSYLDAHYGQQISQQQWIIDVRQAILDRDEAYLQKRFAEHEQQWRTYLSTLPKNRKSKKERATPK